MNFSKHQNQDQHIMDRKIQNNDLYIGYLINGAIQLGISHNYQIVGFCFMDKYCWTNIFGFEKLK